MRAVKIIRANAAKWKINDASIAVCGFSAGAHLAGSLGTICGDLDASAQDEADGFLHLPDIMILCYGVLSMAEWSHIGSRDNLLGEKALEMAEMCSLPEHVSAMTPPAFLMHTICDQMVPYRNSIEFANAMAAAGRPCELVLNYWGEHGMLLGKNTLDVISWPEQADRFIKSVLASETEPDFLERYTHVYQSRQ